MDDGSNRGGKDFSLTGWRVILTDLGISATNVLRRAGMPEDLLMRDAPRVSTDDYYRLWQAVVDESGDPSMPLSLGSAMTPEAFDPPIFAAMCSPDLNTALDRIRTYKRLCGALRLSVSRRPEATNLDITFPLSAVPLPRAMVLAELVFFVQLARICTRAHVRPLEVRSNVDLGVPAAELEAFFGAPVTTGETVQLRFSAEDATRPFLTVNDAMWRFFQPELRRRLSELDTDASTADRVAAALLEMLPSGTASTDAVSSKLGMSKRTLQRRLSAEGLTFQQLLDRTRERLARHYLGSSTMTGAEISFLLGYEDPNSFFRAFHAWTGQTPETVRASLRH